MSLTTPEHEQVTLTEEVQSAPAVVGPGLSVIREEGVALFTGNENHTINLEEAARMTAAFRAKFVNQRKAWYFARQAFLRLLDQRGCVGIRIYGGLSSRKISMVLVAADRHMADLYQGELAELAMPCPPMCAAPNPLNGDLAVPVNPVSLANTVEIPAAFRGTDSHRIDIEIASGMTAAYRDEFPNERQAWYFGRKAILRVLNQPTATGIRIYGGLSKGKIKMVLVGADRNMADLYQGELAEMSWPCPPMCAAPNPLNS